VTVMPGVGAVDEGATDRATTRRPADGVRVVALARQVGSALDAKVHGATA
jgi:hypothetical protein